MQSVRLPIFFLVVATLIFSWIPTWVSGLKFNQLLLSDAEFYAHSMRLMHAGVSAEQGGIPMDSKARGEKILLEAIGSFSERMDWDLLSVSVYLSIACLVLYVLSIYFLSLVTLKSRGWALFLGLVSIVEVHVLGGTTLGFRALGFLPRDLALGLAMWTLTLYVYSVQRDRLKGIYASFLLCGLLANYYTICFVHLCGVLLLAELIRRRRVSPHLVGFLGIWIVAAVPAIFDLLSKTKAWAPVDLEIMRSRNAFMIASPLGDAILRYLRRFIIHVLAAVASVWVIRKYSPESLKKELAPWIPICLSSFLVTMFGLVIESQTEYLRFFFSRASLFFTIGSMLLTVAALRVLAAAWRIKIPNAAVVLTAGAFFAIQSNLGTLVRYWSGLHKNRAEKVKFFKAVEVVREVTPSTAVLLAPSPMMNDIAASLRTYAERKIYVSYKDGGVSLVDGDRARNWLKRYEEQENVLKLQDPFQLRGLMVREGIDYAFLPDNLPISKALEGAGEFEIVGRSEGFLVIRPL